MKKPDQTFDIVIRCTGKMLPTILGALQGAGELRQVVVVDTPPEIHHRRSTVTETIPIIPGQQPPRSRYANGRRFKGIAGPDLVKQILHDSAGPLSYNQIARAFAEKGFAPGSASGALSTLRKLGIVLSLGNGFYQLKDRVPTA